jgi:lipoyl-dependent peroxiredoxin
MRQFMKIRQGQLTRAQCGRIGCGMGVRSPVLSIHVRSSSDESTINACVGASHEETCMSTSTADARWTGNLAKGIGEMRAASRGLIAEFSAASRFASKTGTNPEELLGAAQAGCYAMALSAHLAQAGHPADRVDAQAAVHLDQIGGRYVISRIDLSAHAAVDGLSDREFQRIANEAKEQCPIAQALRVPINLHAELAATTPGAEENRPLRERHG